MIGFSERERNETTCTRSCCKDTVTVITFTEALISPHVANTFDCADTRCSRWKRTLDKLLLQTPECVRQSCAAIAIDGTSSTTIIADEVSLDPVFPTQLYNESQTEAAVVVKKFSPEAHTVTSPSSTLCKLVHYWNQSTRGESNAALYHQADWLSYWLHGASPMKT